MSSQKNMFEFLAGEKKEHYQHFENPHPIKNEISLSRATRARVCFFARNAQRLWVVGRIQFADA